METRGRRGRRSRHRGIQGLISLRVGERRPDIRWKRNCSKLLQRYPVAIIEANLNLPGITNPRHCQTGGWLGVVETVKNQTAPGPQPTAWLRQSRPPPIADPGQQQQLHLPTGVRPRCLEPGRENSTVVGDEEISGLQPSRQITQRGMVPATGGPLDDHQAGGIPRLKRRLGDKRRGQVIVEVRDAEVC